MKKTLTIILCAVLCGCMMSKSQKNEYIDGTSIQIGLYLPINGNLYGLQCINFLTGKKISLTTNQLMKVESEHIISNSISNIGVVTSNRTKIQ